LLAKQADTGVVAGWHGDGNFARTALMWALWKTQGCYLEPWRNDLRIGAVPDGAGGLQIAVAADWPWAGKIRFDVPRHAEYFKMPTDYPRLNQVIFIAILDFNSFEGSDYLTRHLIINQQAQRHDLRDLEFNFIELRKFKKQESELSSLVDKWIYFIKNAGGLTLMPQSAEQVPELKDAYAQANRNTWSKNELELYDYWSIRDAADRYGREDQYDQGKLEGKIEGKIEGQLEAKIEVARKLKAAGVALDIILQTTGLSQADIGQLG
jgi:predicted transposase/invertase (TIGR01784 family)